MAQKIDIEESKNDDSIRMMLSDLNRKQEKINLGGGQKKIDKQHAKGKLIARERIDFL
ncbi:MAG: acetyl-CoA carboxylase carboxyltransferase component, partial [Vicingaceae bacterium]